MMSSLTGRYDEFSSEIPAFSLVMHNVTHSGCRALFLPEFLKIHQFQIFLCHTVKNHLSFSEVETPDMLDKRSNIVFIYQSCTAVFEEDFWTLSNFPATKKLLQCQPVSVIGLLISDFKCIAFTLSYTVFLCKESPAMLWKTAENFALVTSSAKTIHNVSNAPS